MHRNEQIEYMNSMFWTEQNLTTKANIINYKQKHVSTYQDYTASNVSSELLNSQKMEENITAVRSAEQAN